MKNSMLTALFALLLSSFSFAQNCQDANIPNRPIPGFISTVRNNLGDEAIGQTYDFNLKPFQKSSAHEVIMKFNLAYTYFPGRYDSLAIQVSTNCGKSWETIFYSGGEDLSTTSPSTEYFVPKQNDWKSYQFDLHRFSGIILIRFRFINGNGNNLYLDDLGFQEGLADNQDLRGMNSNLYPNPFHDTAVLKFDQSVEDATMLIIDSLGQEIMQLNNVQGEEIQLEAKDLNPGLYYYLLLMKGQSKSYGQFAIVD